MAAGAVHPRHSLPSTRYCPLVSLREWSGLLWARACATPECLHALVSSSLRTVLVLVSECDACWLLSMERQQGAHALGLQHRVASSSPGSGQTRLHPGDERGGRRGPGAAQGVRWALKEFDGELHGKRFLGASCMYRLGRQDNKRKMKGKDGSDSFPQVLGSLMPSDGVHPALDSPRLQPTHSLQGLHSLEKACKGKGWGFIGPLSTRLLLKWTRPTDLLLPASLTLLVMVVIY